MKKKHHEKPATSIEQEAHMLKLRMGAVAVNELFAAVEAGESDRADNAADMLWGIVNDDGSAF